MSKAKIDEIIQKGGCLVLAEAGGKSALSTYFFIHDFVAKNNIIVLDTNKAILNYWRGIGIRGFLTMKDMVEVLPTTKFYMLPCSEVDIKTAAQHGVSQGLNSGDPEIVHNKLLSYKLIEHKCIIVKVPRIFTTVGGAVVRGIHSSGSKDTHLFDSDYIVTERLQGFEYEVDFNTYSNTIYPLLSYNRKNGYNNHVSLIGVLHPMYSRLKKAVNDVTKALDIEGVGTVQFIHNTTGLYYIEAALRIHGSSKVFNLMGGNPITGASGDLNFDSKDVICDLGVV